MRVWFCSTLFGIIKKPSGAEIYFFVVISIMVDLIMSKWSNNERKRKMID
jgi:hypothetical protein